MIVREDDPRQPVDCGQKSVLSRFAVICGVIVACGLSACNGKTAQPLETDWVQEPIVSTPTPTPTATPSPSPTPPVTQLYIGPADLEKYVSKFIDDAKIQGVDVLPDMKNPILEIRVASLDSYGGSVIGLCETGGGKRRVTFDPDFWDSVSETQRELLAHHELGHCVLYRGHRTTVLSGGAYASVMYPIIMSSSTYLNNYAYYQEELFTQAAMSVPDVAPSASVTHICNLDHP